MESSRNARRRFGMGQAHITWVLERIQSKIKLNEVTGCWEWTSHIDPAGYARVSVESKSVYVHRLAWSATHNDAEPEVIDHLCRVRHCVNPEHLENVSNRTNIIRGMEPRAIAHRNGTCLKGHPASEIYRRKSTGGAVQCRACMREKKRTK